jgi:tRNA 5-methylaminomethyl-2-thiouridine biosynthesis bifunctional protein
LNHDPRHVLVIGAGLAGAAICATLARRGWRITLIDAASGPAQAASALPVGMLSPHVTRSPTPLSRLSELGVAATRAELQRLVPQGAGWQACEVDNLQHDPGRWPAALVRPGALVEAWLSEASLATAWAVHWNARVQALQYRPTTQGSARWAAVSSDGQTIAEADHVVVAGAYGSHALLSGTQTWLPPEALPLRPVKGQMSLAALKGDPLAQRPQRQNGVFVPKYEDTGLPPAWPARIWSMGSTYDRGDNTTETTAGAHNRNAESLGAMHPEAREAMESAQSAGQLMGWAQVRCASLDRLPLAGALPDVAAMLEVMNAAGVQRGRLPLDEVPRWPGLFTLSALGSRGLTLALPMAQWVVDCIADEASSNLPEDLQRAVDPARFAWRQARRQPLPS